MQINFAYTAQKLIIEFFENLTKPCTQIVWMICGAFLFARHPVFAQADSVDVTFFYKPSGNPSVVYLPGEFNNWGPNSNGTIAANAPSRMTFDSALGQWTKTVRLRVGGQPGGGVPGAYQYKFNENGASNGWRSDPLNPRRNAADHDNSYLYVRNPTIHYLLPNVLSPAVKTRFPEITAYIFSTTTGGIDTASIRIKIDSMEYSHLGAHYDPVSKKLSFVPTGALGNGSHQLKLSVRSTSGTFNADSTSFTVLGDAVQIVTQPATTRKTGWPIRAEIYKMDGTLDTAVASAVIKRGAESWTVTVASGKIDTTITLIEGENVFTLEATVNSVVQSSAPITITQIVNHSPYAVITIDSSNAALLLKAGNSSDPDGQNLTFVWDEDSTNPAAIGISGFTDSTFSVSQPRLPGEYYYTLTATDPDGHTDVTRNYFTVLPNGQVMPATLASNPSWVKSAIVYEIFIDSFTPQGTLGAAKQKLEYIKAMGATVLWLMPIMDNNYIINGVGAGYDIVDFYKVAPEYGTNQDFVDFVNRAHELGMKVVLDITPNHTSAGHPFAADIRLHGVNSAYWNYYQHTLITNSNYHPNLPERKSTNGLFVYYDGFSEELINYNWSDLDAREYMLEVYRFWIDAIKADGFRFDVYWGPARRANNGNGGENEMGLPVRQALKNIKPDIWLLAEDSGVGFGTEKIYGDRNGGVDSGYDWPLYFDGFRVPGQTTLRTGSVAPLHDKIFNNNFYPGPNSYFFRFLENHDETRVAKLATSIQQTLPFATTLMTIPGVPLIYAGQEVGFGNNLDDFTGKRGTVNFSDPDRSVVQSHYQKLCYIRTGFPAFWTQTLRRINQSDSNVYVFVRPFTDENAIVAANFSNTTRSATITINSSAVEFSGGVQPNMAYHVSEMLTGVITTIQGDASGSSSFSVSLPAYGSAIYMVSTEAESISVPDLPTGVDEHSATWRPQEFVLRQNYPNPFNPETTIRFELPETAEVSARIFNVLGEEVATLVQQRLPAGTHVLRWNGLDRRGRQAGSGIYFLRLSAGKEVAVRKMMLVR